VDLLLGDLLGRSLGWLIAHGEEPLDPAPLEALLVRRFAGEPVQYIRRKTDFFSRELYVDERVLIPRPETEVLVETAIERAPRGARVVDVGTGSGCIAISLQRERPDLRVLGVDRSLDALAVADLNRRRLDSPVRLAASDLLGSTRVLFDVVVSNPPYVPEKEVLSLMREVREWEPRMALTPGVRGTEVIERLVEQAGRALILMEMGYGQEAAVREVFRAHGRRIDAVLPDLAGIPRVVVSSAPW
jgi:release factor glutamine methyltransferase